jgi:hypothetical protein
MKKGKIGCVAERQRSEVVYSSPETPKVAISGKIQRPKFAQLCPPVSAFSGSSRGVWPWDENYASALVRPVVPHRELPLHPPNSHCETFKLASYFVAFSR